MKSLISQIAKDPQNASQLLDSYPAENKEVRAFLNSLKEIPVYLVPPMINAFLANYRHEEPQTLLDLSLDEYYVGSMFTLKDGTGYTYLGLVDGKAACRPDNSHIIDKLDLSTEIKWVF